MIDGIWWLVILMAVIVGLWFFAKSRAPNNLHDTKSRDKKKPINDALQKTAEMIKQYFPDYRVTRKGSHLLVTRQNIKIAMITIDPKLAASQRRLGDIPVINYQRVPSRAQLDANLQEAE
ncbi:hypothetical protein [Psychrobacter cryohalolentis]|uniref:DUF2726 domain-containing protein n=1 Tax=Psychrobacter cryohalolentis (strain ATCC BAA-1226 / DSM 17306 / VKM B-2378 / K5) TaxID=335284 RepID=Q1QDL2_PSYCK|nr:hypothetical protein [Psychrobacter cryohalolentis]ABE74241.1 conserved hypothetical protein [Psychrobacter cryohalolentis K5]ASE26873.1 hypothetical protein CEP87_09870 [Psychrobacter cryohalolentis]